MDEFKKQAEILLKAIQDKTDQELTVKLASSTVKMTKDECRTLCGKIGLAYKEGFEDRVIQFRMTDATADRHNEVVLPEGVNLKSFKKDPVILLQHASWQFPIGKSLETTFNKDTNDITGKILFFDDELDRSGISEDTFRMVKSGAMKNGSIGFSAKHDNIRMASPEELTQYGLGKYGVIFDKIELREFSIVTIPANPNATQIAARKGMYRKGTLDALKAKGLSDEEYKALLDGNEDDEEEHPFTTMIKESNGGGELVTDPDTSVTDPDITKDEPSENPVFNLSIPDNLTPEEMEKKFETANMAKRNGFKVTITTYEPKAEPVIDKAGAVLSKKNKEIIETTLNSIKSLQTQLTDLLEAAKSTTETEDSEDDKTVTPGESKVEDEQLRDLYDQVDRLNEVT